MTPISPFLPPRRLLLGPGPSEVSDRVLQAMARPTIGHLDPEFIRMMDELKELLQYAFQTKNDVTLVVSGPGSAGMECCFVNLVEPGEKVLVCRNGVFGGRMKENVERCRGVPVLVEGEWGRAVDPEILEAAFRKNPDARIAAFVHAETSTGARSDAELLVRIIHDHGALAIVDAVTSLGGIPVLVDDWNLDAVYSGSQKCLSCVPGLSPVTFNARAIEKIRSRKTQVQSWFLDLTLITAYWNSGSKRVYHHTAPVNTLYALHEALLILREETLEKSWARHERSHLQLRAGLESLGLGFLVPESERLPQLNAVLIPSGVEDAATRKALLEKHGIEIGAGLGPLAGKIWRIGLMGQSATEKNVQILLRALESLLNKR